MRNECVCCDLECGSGVLARMLWHLYQSALTWQYQRDVNTTLCCVFTAQMCDTTSCYLEFIQEAFLHFIPCWDISSHNFYFLPHSERIYLWATYRRGCKMTLSLCRCDWSVQECRWCIPYHHEDQQRSLQEGPQPNRHNWQRGGSHIVGGGGNNYNLSLSLCLFLLSRSVSGMDLWSNIKTHRAGYN